MHFITLTDGMVCAIDGTDLSLVSQYTWFHKEYNGCEYAVTYTGGKTIFMHRLIMGDPKGLQVDHEDGNGLNNQRSNLRVATYPQNQANQRLSKANTLGYKGIVRLPSGRYRAQAKCYGVRYYLGAYDTKEEAAKIYDAFMVTQFGDFAMTNEKLGLFIGS